MAIRLMTVEDIPAADGVLQRAHAMDLSFAGLLRRNLLLTPRWWWVDAEDGAITGVVGATDFADFAHIGLMAIDPARQRGGAGRALMEFALAAVEATHRTVTLYSTDAGLRLYQSLDFRWAGVTTEWEFHGKAPMAARKLEASTDFARIAAMDRPWFGGDRARLFPLLEFEEPGRIFVCDHGYLCAQATVLGPFAAATPETAEALLAAALTLEFTGRPRVAIPTAHAHAEEMLLRYGFRPFRTSRYVVRGPAPVARRECLYGIAAYSLG